MSYVRYIDKTRAYYLSQGYDKPYAWAHNEAAPFTPLAKPLAQSTLALVSTSEIAIRDEPGFEKRADMQGAGNVYSIPSDTPVPRLYSRTHSYDKYETSLEADVNAFLPIERLREAAAAGRIGALGARMHGVYNAYSQRRTREVDAPAVLARCREDLADVALLVPV
jgi:hypothetical protein